MTTCIHMYIYEYRNNDDSMLKVLVNYVENMHEETEDFGRDMETLRLIWKC